MSKVINSALELIGNTPLLNASRYAKNAGIEGVTLLTKLEYLNPAGSVKDRVALAMIEDAEKKGELKPGAMIIEPTSGNTGIGLAAVAVAKGYRAVLTLPDTMSVERRNLLKAYGAEIVLTEGAKGMKGAIAKAEELKEQNPGSVILGQFVNPANPAVHKATTGPEIWEQTEGKVDIFVAGVGTGGTVTGVGEYLKSQNPDVKVVAVEPATSPVLSKGEAGPHKIQGIAALIFNSIRDGATVYYFKYFIVENSNEPVTFLGIPFVLSGLYLAIGQAANIIGVVLAAPVSNRIGKKRTYMWAMVVATVLSIVFYWFDKENLVLIFIFQILISICAGSIFPLLWSMYADCVDYSELKTGNRATGLIFSSSSMSQKFGWAIGSAVTGWLLGYFGFQANVVQNDQAINGIRMFLSFLPAIGTLLSILFISMYPLSERRMKEIIGELEQKRNQH